MAKAQTQEEVIEQQRADSLKAFADKSNYLQKEIREYELKLKNLKENFAIENAKKIEEVKSLEDELRLKMQDADNNKHLTSVALAETNKKLSECAKLQVELNGRLKLHNDMINDHIGSCAEQRDDILRRDEASAARENNSKILDLEAADRLKKAIEKENEIEDKSSKLVHISNNIMEDIKVQKELKNSNEELLSEINKGKLDIVDIQSSINFSRSENIKLRDDLDIATARLSKRKSELDEKDAALKAAQLRLEVASQTITSREQALNDQMGKLSQLKADVEILLKQKEAKESEA